MVLWGSGGSADNANNAISYLLSWWWVMRRALVGSQWVFGVRFQNMALTRLDHRFVDLTRDGHSPTIGSTIHLN